MTTFVVLVILACAVGYAASRTRRVWRAAREAAAAREQALLAGLPGPTDTVEVAGSVVDDDVAAAATPPAEPPSPPSAARSVRTVEEEMHDFFKDARTPLDGMDASR